jgi:hypothetical protein
VQQQQCNQLQVIYNLNTEIALCKFTINTLNKEVDNLRKKQNANTVLLITALAGIIGILLQVYFNK